MTVKRYALFEVGAVGGAFYSDDIHGPRERPVYEIVRYEPNPETMIDPNAVEITEEQYQDFHLHQGRRIWNGSGFDEYELPPSPLPVPHSLSRRQFFQQLAIVGFITKAEALDAIRTGAIPTELGAMLDDIEDEDERFNAEMLLSGAGEFQRDHYLTDKIGAQKGMTSEQIDSFFSSAGAL